MDIQDCSEYSEKRISKIIAKKETPFDFTGYESQSISLEFTKYVDFRIDIGVALKKLNETDQEIIALRFLWTAHCLKFLRLSGCVRVQ